MKPGGGGRHRQVGKNACRWNVAIAKCVAQHTQTSVSNFISPPRRAGLWSEGEKKRRFGGGGSFWGLGGVAGALACKAPADTISLSLFLSPAGPLWLKRVSSLLMQNQLGLRRLSAAVIVATFQTCFFPSAAQGLSVCLAPLPCIMCQRRSAAGFPLVQLTVFPAVHLARDSFVHSQSEVWTHSSLLAAL